MATSPNFHAVSPRGPQTNPHRRVINDSARRGGRPQAAASPRASMTSALCRYRCRSRRWPGFCCAADGLDVLDGRFFLDRGNRGYQLRHPSKVLSDRCKGELVLCTARTTQSMPPELEDALQVREPHLDALALATRLLIGASERSGDITSAFMDAARDPTLRCFWTASGFEIAFCAVGHTTAIENRVSRVEPARRR
jgi:hypothetical protein